MAVFAQKASDCQSDEKPSFVWSYLLGILQLDTSTLALSFLWVEILPLLWSSGVSKTWEDTFRKVKSSTVK